MQPSMSTRVGSATPMRVAWSPAGARPRPGVAPQEASVDAKRAAAAAAQATAASVAATTKAVATHEVPSIALAQAKAASGKTVASRASSRERTPATSRPASRNPPCSVEAAAPQAAVARSPSAPHCAGHSRRAITAQAVSATSPGSTVVPPLGAGASAESCVLSARRPMHERPPVFGASGSENIDVGFLCAENLRLRQELEKQRLQLKQVSHMFGTSGDVSPEPICLHETSVAASPDNAVADVHEPSCVWQAFALRPAAQEREATDSTAAVKDAPMQDPADEDCSSPSCFPTFGSIGDFVPAWPSANEADGSLVGVASSGPSCITKLEGIGDVGTGNVMEPLSGLAPQMPARPSPDESSRPLCVPKLGGFDDVVAVEKAKEHQSGLTPGTPAWPFADEATSSVTEDVSSWPSCFPTLRAFDDVAAVEKAKEHPPCLTPRTPAWPSADEATSSGKEEVSSWPSCFPTLRAYDDVVATGNAKLAPSVLIPRTPACPSAVEAKGSLTKEVSGGAPCFPTLKLGSIDDDCARKNANEQLPVLMPSDPTWSSGIKTNEAAVREDSSRPRSSPQPWDTNDVITSAMSREPLSCRPPSALLFDTRTSEANSGENATWPSCSPTLGGLRCLVSTVETNEPLSCPAPMALSSGNETYEAATVDVANSPSCFPKLGGSDDAVAIAESSESPFCFQASPWLLGSEANVAAAGEDFDFDQPLRFPTLGRIDNDESKDLGILMPSTSTLQSASDQATYISAVHDGDAFVPDSKEAQSPILGASVPVATSAEESALEQNFSAPVSLPLGAKRGGQKIMSFERHQELYADSGSDGDKETQEASPCLSEKPQVSDFPRLRFPAFPGSTHPRPLGFSQLARESLVASTEPGSTSRELAQPRRAQERSHATSHPRRGSSTLGDVGHDGQDSVTASTTVAAATLQAPTTATSLSGPQSAPREPTPVAAARSTAPARAASPSGDGGAHSASSRLPGGHLTPREPTLVAAATSTTPVRATSPSGGGSAHFASAATSSEALLHGGMMKRSGALSSGTLSAPRVGRPMRVAPPSHATLPIANGGVYPVNRFTPVPQAAIVQVPIVTGAKLTPRTARSGTPNLVAGQRSPRGGLPVQVMPWAAPAPTPPIPLAVVGAGGPVAAQTAPQPAPQRRVDSQGPGLRRDDTFHL